MSNFQDTAQNKPYLNTGSFADTDSFANRDARSFSNANADSYSDSHADSNS